MENNDKNPRRHRFSSLFKRKKNTLQTPKDQIASPAAQTETPTKASKAGPLPIDIVKKYSPVFQFHPDERCFPCSIEHLLHNSVLLYRNFAWPTQIGQSSSSTPSLASYQGWLYLAYQDSNAFHMYISRTQDGYTWKDTEKIPGIEGGAPTLVVFQDKLWMVWHGALSTQLWIAQSTDGLHWANIQKISGQQAWNTSITVHEKEMFMVYTDPLSSELWTSQSANGITWSNTRRIDGQSSAHASVTTFKGKVIMVYAHPAIDNSTLYITSFDQNQWSTPSIIQGQDAAVPVLTVIGDWLFMVYAEPNLSSQFWASRSLDGISWQDTTRLPGQHGDIPALSVYRDVVYILYRVGRNLYSTSCENGDLSIHEPIHNPSQSDLAAHSNESHYVKIDPKQYPGQSIPTAPMYYAVQEQGDTVTIHYPILYANQTGQTCRAVALGFDCSLETLGYHQGDLERFNITLQRKNNDYEIIHIGFEAHGVLIQYNLLIDVKWEGETHAIVHVFYLRFVKNADHIQVALNGHASRNQDPATGPVLDLSVPGIVSIGDWLGTGLWWRPAAEGSEFKLLGLDASGNPIGDQLWSVFRGHLGDTVENSLTSATYFDGRTLSAIDWDYVKTIFGFASVLDLIGSQYFLGDSPTGPNGWNRTWVQNSSQ